MIYLTLILINLTLIIGEKTKIEGSKSEIVKANEDVAKPYIKSMDQLKFGKATLTEDPNVVMIANGHKPAKGRQAAGEILKVLEEWGPGLKWNQKEIVMSVSKDLAANMGTGSYKNMERLTYLVVLKKIGKRWFSHMGAFHQWIRGAKDKKRVKRDTTGGSALDIRGNNTAAINEAKKLLTKWEKDFLAGDSKGITELYTNDCIILDNKHQPKKGKKYAELSIEKMMKKYGQRLNTTLMGISTSTAGDLVGTYGIWKDGDSFGNFLRVLKLERKELKIRFDMFSHETAV